MKTFLHTYQKLNANNLETLKDIYRDDVQFIDPAHEISGITNLTEYFASLYRNIDSINFSFNKPVVHENRGYVSWKMTFSHKNLARGKSITIEGMTYLQFDEHNKVYHHRDYFDLGAMLYEHIPLIGRIIKWIKRGLGK